jgi:hypothetical protein
VSKALISDWLRVATRLDVVLRGLRVAAVVGTILVAINHGDLIATGTMSIESVWKILLTYCVPYFVSTYANVAAIISTAGIDAKSD